MEFITLIIRFVQPLGCKKMRQHFSSEYEVSEANECNEPISGANW